LDVRVVWFDEADLRLQAGDTWYARGLDYVDKVDELSWSPDVVTATVRGSDEYQVRLSNSRGLVDFDCSCPWGHKDNFCKHCVAVGLAALNAAAAQPPPPEPEPASEDGTELRTSLDRLEKAVLVDLLVELAGKDPALHQLLSFRTRPEDFDPAEIYPMVDGLKRTWSLGDVALATLCRAADDALRTLDTYATNHPVAVRPLYQLALRHLAAADAGGQPDGNLAVLRAAVARAISGVITTSRTEPTPDPVEFAVWLIDVQIRSNRFLELSVGQFAEILGDQGLKRYWRCLSDLDKAASTFVDEEAGRRRRRAIFRLRESYLTDIVKDVDQLVAFYAENLQQPDRYLRIGETLRDAERFDEAIAWLDRGLAEARSGRTAICDFLVAVCNQTGRLKDAARARLDNFSRDPDEYNYRMLLKAAETIDAAPYAHEQAMTVLRERAAGYETHAADPLVTILIAIDDIDQAWAAAQEFTCSDKCLFLLARNRAKHHPADAIPVYAREVDAAIDRKDRFGYERAAELLVAMRDLHQRAGLDFGAYLDNVKSTHRRKSAFMKHLTAADL
jgi:tetratricopeptide (TPR) repeat protein